MKYLKSYYHIGLLAGLFVLFQPNIFAQQKPVFNTYTHNPEYYNPAFLGDGYAAVVYNVQWAGELKESAPKTFALFTDFSPFMGAFSDRIGLGLNLQSDVTIFRRTNADVHFAYHLLKSEAHNFSLGIVAGILQQRTDITDKRVYNPEDPTLFSDAYSNLVFDGGFGFAYQYKKSDKSLFSFDLTLPQLFTSDIKNKDNENSAEFDNRFHVLAGLRYRINTEKIGIEPSLLFRGVNAPETLLPLHTLDVGANVYFLDNRFWMGGGTRLGGLAYYGRFGVKATDNLNLQGDFSWHNEWKASYEISINYRFNKPKPPPPPPVGEKNSIKKLNDITKLLTRVKSNPNLNNDELEKLLGYSQNAYKQANYTGLSKEAVMNKLKEAEAYLKQAKPELEKYLVQAQEVENEILRSKNIAFQHINDKEIKKIDNDNVRLGNEIIDMMVEDYEVYIRLIGDVRNLQYKKEIEVPISELALNDDVQKLKLQLANDLSEIPGMSESTVDFEESDKWKITYTFPDLEDSYTIGEGLTRRSLMLNHIKEQIEKLEKAGLIVESKKIRCLLWDEVANMKNAVSNVYLREEFGSLVVLPHLSKDAESETFVKLQTQIRQGDMMSKYELACLKLYSIGQSLGNKQTLKYEITGANYDGPDKCIIEISLKK